jgi:N-acetylmuramoyl-L-alanine amidase
VRPGSSADEVRAVQDLLHARGFHVPPTEHGVFGSHTDAIIRAFQAFRGIRVDGICGSETWAAIFDSGFVLGDRLLCSRSPMVRGDDVAELQDRLNALGFDAGKEDGIFGPHTERAVTEFQRNTAITSDGICGRETLETLRRLGTRAGGAVAAARERDALRDASGLTDRRVYITAGAGLELLAGHLARGLRDAGAHATLEASDDDDSRVAAAANAFAADLFLAVRPRVETIDEPDADATCRCYFYASRAFRAEAGYAVATALAEQLGTALGGAGVACGRAYTVLRETSMTAVVCEPVIEGDPVSLAALEARAEELAATAVRAIRSVLDRPGD